MKRLALLTLFCATTSLFAQKTYEQEKYEEHKKTAKRVGVGAVGGTVVGALAGGKKGALIGAAAGGGTGAMYDHHKKKTDRERQ